MIRPEFIPGMPESVAISFDNCHAKVLTDSRAVVQEVYNLLSYHVEGFRHTKAHKQNGWDGTMSFFRRVERKFPTGFIRIVAEHLKGLGITVKFRNNTIPLTLELPTDDQLRTIMRGKALRDYQLEAVKTMLKRFRGILKSPTGSGKTLMAGTVLEVVRRNGYKCLFITPAVELLGQTARLFKEHTDHEAGIIGDGHHDFSKDITVATIQTLYWPFTALNELEEIKKKHTVKTLEEDRAKALELINQLEGVIDSAPAKLSDQQKERLKKIREQIEKKQEELAEIDHKIQVLKSEEKIHRRVNEMIAFLESINAIILDEAHLSDAKSWQTIVDHCKNAYMRIAITATPLMKGDEEDLRLIATTGPIIHTVPMKLLIDLGYLAQPLVKFVPVREPVLPKKKKECSFGEACRKGIYENEHRHRLIIRETLDLAVGGAQVLVLVTRKAHGKTLLKMFQEDAPHIPSAYVDGDKNREERDKAIKDISTGTLQVLFSSTILDTGVDMPAVSAVILAGGQRSLIRLYQRIGRGMRPKKTGENIVYIVDFIDLTHKYLAIHSKERYLTVKAEEGYKVVEKF